MLPMAKANFEKRPPCFLGFEEVFSIVCASKSIYEIVYENYCKIFSCLSKEFT